MNEDRLTAPAMLSFKKKVSSIKDFNTKVIEKFANNTTGEWI
jgi:hypothetical protein